MTSWAELAARATTTPAEIKAQLDLSAVVMSYGVTLTPLPGGEKLIGLCPFHDDTQPSLTVWRNERDEWQVGCWACDFGPGDLFTFIMRWHECGFAEAMQITLDLDEDDLPEPPPINKETVIRATMSIDKIMSRGTETAAVQELLRARNIRVPPTWVIEEFDVRADGDTVLIPHYGSGNQLIAVKRRSPELGWKNIAARGSELTELYGAWRLRSLAPIILCEGESDTWTVSYAYQGVSVNVLGLPSGVSTTPRNEWIDLLTGWADTVVLAFDGDRAGRLGVVRWIDAIGGRCVNLRVAVLPDGEDASSIGPDGVKECIGQSGVAEQCRDTLLRLANETR
jgi:DNA primase